MLRNRYSVNIQQSSNHNIITKKDSSELSKEDLKKLSVNNDSFNEKDLRKLIYVTESEESSNDSASDIEDTNITKCKSVSQPLHKCGDDGNNSSENDPEKMDINIEQNEPRKLSTSEKLKQIAKENEMLAKKILAQQKPKKKNVNDIALNKVSSSAAVNRKKAQWSIDRTNQILYKKIQAAKPSGLSVRKGVSLGRNTKLTA